MNDVTSNAIADAAAHTLPLYLSGSAALLWTLLTIILMARLRDRMGAFLLFALLFRYLLAAFFTFSFKSSPVGMSYNALGSLAVMGMGLVLINPRHLAFKMLFPFYALMLVATISAAASGDSAGYISAITKYGYLVVVIVVTYDALVRLGDRLMPSLLVVFAGPLLFQLLSIAFHVSKASEADGSTSYIGGFAHEAPFSIILGTGIVVAAMARRVRPLWTNLAILVLIAGIFVANYRTSILALGPLVLMVFLASSVRSIGARQRAFAASLALAVAIVGVAGLGIAGSSRFADLGDIGQIPTLLTEPTAQMTRADQRVFSGRVMLWNININAWRAGTPKNWLLGAGPEVRAPGALLYPHNTLVAAIYETGALGALALIAVWAAMLRVAWRVRAPDRPILVTAHVSFIILNMATMPIWYIEGTLYYGLLCGYSFYRYRVSRGHALVALRGPASVPRSLLNYGSPVQAG